jgi:DNA (cytosine-5)-methyltransferase 1
MGKFDTNSVFDAVDELLVDNFAGGGGASEGISNALGREVDIAINHDAEALAMHAQNHPGTKHYYESVFDVDPVKATKGKPVGVAWFSPDCRHHSKAKGGKPREQGIRGLAWIAVRWGVLVRPRIIILENVTEFQDWGPLDDKGHPIKSQAGVTFKSFVACLSTGIAKDDPAIDEIKKTLGDNFPIERLIKGLGYKVEHKVIRACNLGAPTIRKRLFLIARCDGMAIELV